MDQAEKKEKLKQEIKGMLLAAMGLFILIALLSYNANDGTANSFSSEAGYRNFCGMFGAQVADILLECAGLAAYLVPAALLYLAYRLLRFKELRWRLYKGIAFLGLVFSVSSLFAFNIEFTEFLGQRVLTGGAIGFKSAELLRGYLGIPGALLVLLPMLAVSIMVLSRFSFVLFADWWIKTLGEKWSRFRERRALNREIMRGEPKGKEHAAPVIKPPPPPVTPPPRLPRKSRNRKSRRRSRSRNPLISPKGTAITGPRRCRSWIRPLPGSGGWTRKH